ncbi:MULTISPECIES: hypothetical protein [Actinosynnema]|uniref:hypothetical protein n=1 Tax=Actinosynnema TaxID=40566 RepID=UPI0020A4E871|nr:hypothetical protein [Actinosynnema pretiosum]MCP2098184.1 hypothetical protein [Actinosynnema pretiosum]
MTLEHAGSHYGVQYVYNVDAELWQVELCEAMPVPKADRHLLGVAFATALVSDADPKHEAVVRFEAGVRESIPFAVLSWYLEAVTAEVERCRAVLVEQGVRRAIPRQDRASGGTRGGAGRKPGGRPGVKTSGKQGAANRRVGAGKAAPSKAGSSGVGEVSAPAAGTSAPERIGGASSGLGAAHAERTGVELVSAAKTGIAEATEPGGG